MFDPKGFAPIAVNGPPKFPRYFGYANEEDLLAEVMKPGYFNSQKIILKRNSYIKVVCKDAVAEIIIDKIQGDVTVRDEIFMASDPWEDAKSRGRAGKPAKAKAKKKETKLAKTG